jgi:hypothetical protein
MNDAEMKQSIFAVREELGNMLRDTMWPLHDILGLSGVINEDEADRKGKAIVAMYKQLIAADIDKATALQMVQKLFIEPADVANIVREYMQKNQEIARDIVIALINAQAAKG